MYINASGTLYVMQMVYTIISSELNHRKLNVGGPGSLSAHASFYGWLNWTRAYWLWAMTV